MTPMTEILTRVFFALVVADGTHQAVMCREVAEGLREIYPDGQVPASEVILVEELFLIRITSFKMEQLLGNNGMYFLRGEKAMVVIHPAMASTMRNRERFKKTWNCLAWRHGVAGLQPSREKALAKAANQANQANGVTTTTAPSVVTKNGSGNGAAISRTPVAAPPKPAAHSLPPNAGPLVVPAAIPGGPMGTGKVTRESFLRPVKEAVAV